MTFKKSGIGILIFLCLAYQLGVRKVLVCSATLVFGYFAAELTVKTNFSIPCMYKIVKKKLVRSKSCIIPPPVISHRRSSSSSSIQSTGSLESGSMHKKLKSKLSASLLAKDVNFETYFRHNHPWQSVYIPENVEKACEEFLSLIIQNFILDWYSQVSADDGLIYEIKAIFRHILANIIIRLKQVDVNYFAVYKLNTILANHISDFYFCHEAFLKSQQKDLQNLTQEQRIAIQHELLRNIAVRNESHSPEGGHFALTSRQHELVYLRQTSKKILPFLLPNHVVKCRLSMELVEEIFVNKILLKGLDILAEPDTFNKILIKIFEANDQPANAELTNPPDQAQVQVLKHWCLMNGCIFKTIKSPSLKEIFENNELLHHFIGYMNSIHSIAVLQLYLNLRDILRSHTGEMSSSCYSTCSAASSPTSSQIQELKVWCQNATNKQTLRAIAYDSEQTFHEVIHRALNEDSIDNSQENRYQALEKIHDEILNLIKEIYYSSFIKSEFMYRNVIGLNKLMPKLKASVRNSETTSLNSMNLGEARSENNLVFDQDFEDLGYPTTYSTTSGQVNSHPDDTADSLNGDEEYEEEGNDFRQQQAIRLDLINEIKDEILDERVEAGSMVNGLSSGGGEGRVGDEAEEEDEDEANYAQEEIEANDLNLSNLRICIDDIEELTDKSNKTCFVFVIQVWNLQPTFRQLDKGIKADEFDEVPTWFVKRKYDEFYVLDTRLKEFHGETIGVSETNRPGISSNLPAKQRTMFLQSDAKILEYLNSVKLDFSKYLQSLITNPILSMSQLIRSFLDPSSTEFGSSIFNDITSLGKIVKGVPLKLRLERGQSLDSFLLVLLQSVKEQKPKTAKIETITEDIIGESLNNPLYTKPGSFQSKSHVGSKKSTKGLNDLDEVLMTPFESFILLIKLLYKLPDMLCLLIFSLRKFVQSWFDYLLYWLISRKLNELTTPVHIAKYIRLFKELIFDDDNSEKIPEDIVRENACKTINEYIYEEIKLEKLVKVPFVSGRKIEETVEKGTRLCVESFQYPVLNKQLTYYLLDALVQELIPEIVKK